MDQCTHEVRAEYWRNIIKACGQRPAGQSAKKWMDENGICEQSYYHWQRKFRQQAYDQMKEKEMLPSVAEKAEVSFAEIPYSPVIGRKDIPGVNETGCASIAAVIPDFCNKYRDLKPDFRISPGQDPAGGIQCLRMRQGSGVWSLPAEQLTSGRGLMGWQ